LRDSRIEEFRDSGIQGFRNLEIDESVKSQKIDLLSFRRKPESIHFNSFWTPAFAGVTGWKLFTKASGIKTISFYSL
jgi:hypothetical protein